MNHSIRSLFCVLALVAATTVSAREFHYAEVTNFFEFPPGGQHLGPCHGGTVIDKSGNIYVTTDTERGVLVYSSKGKFLRAFGPGGIHGLELRKEKGVEYIYGARPNAHDVLKLDLQGKVIWTIKYPKESGVYKEEKEFKPCAVTVGPDGEIFVADGYGSNYILKFDKDLKFIKAFGGPAKAKETGKFNTCHGIALDTRSKTPLLFVCNRNNNRIEYWDLDGNFVKIIQDNLRMPAAVSIRGRYAVVPELQGRVTLLDKDGSIVAQVGDNPNEKQRANFGLPIEQFTVGICNSPHGAALDKDDNIIVTEWSQSGHLHKFALTK